MLLKILIFIYCIVGIIFILFIPQKFEYWTIFMLFGGVISFLIPQENEELTKEELEELKAKIEKIREEREQEK